VLATMITQEIHHPLPTSIAKKEQKGVLYNPVMFVCSLGGGRGG